MERISSLFFMLSLIVYYIPKVCKIRKSKYVKYHVGLGIISVGTMILALISKVGQVDFIKYIGFTTIMILIGVSGYLLNKNYKLYKVLHIIFTLSFFIYLAITIR